MPKGWLGLGLVASTLGLSQHLPVPPWCWGASGIGRKQRALPGPPRPLQPPSPSQRRVWDVRLAGVRLEGPHSSPSTGVPKSGARERSSLRREPGLRRQQFGFEDGVVCFIWLGPSPPANSVSGPGPGEDGEGAGPLWLTPCGGLAASARAAPRQL